MPAAARRPKKANKTPPSMPQNPVLTLAELVHRLGDVPLERIRLHPPIGAAKVADVERTRARWGVLCELVDGTLVQKGMGYEESAIAVALSSRLFEFVQSRGLGVVTGESGMMSLQEALVRIPDVAFVSWDRFPNRRISNDPIPRIAPDLAVEILSKSNTRAEMKRKRAEYFEAGTRLVWEIEPKKRIARVYTAPQQFTTLEESQSLDGGDVLPGFALPLQSLFDVLGRHG